MDARSDVYFKINKPIKSNELDLVIMYLENKKKSNGGDINDYSYDELSSVLKVIFEKIDAKQGVLNKAFHKILDYVLIAYETIENEINLKSRFHGTEQSDTLIIANVDTCDNGDRKDAGDSVLTLLAEYLVQENDLVSIKQSKLFKTSYFIKYKDLIDFEQAQKRLLKKQKTLFKSTKLYQAAKTGLYLTVDSDCLIELLSNQRQSDIFTIFYIKKFNRFLIHSKIDLVLNDSDTIEYLFSIDLLIDEFAASGDSVNELNEKFDKLNVKPVQQVTQPSPSPPVSVPQQQQSTIISDEQIDSKPVQNIQDSFDPSKLNYIVINSENPLYLAIKHCKQINSDINLNLNQFNAQFVNENDQQQAFKIVYQKFNIPNDASLNIVQLQHQQWLNNVTNIIEQFEKCINFAQLKLSEKVFSNVAHVKVINDYINTLNMSKSDLYINLNQSNYVSIIGYENSVQYSYNVLNVVIRQSQQPQVNMKIQAPPQPQPTHVQMIIPPPMVTTPIFPIQPQWQNYQVDLEPLVSLTIINCQDIYNHLSGLLYADNAKFNIYHNQASIVQLNQNFADVLWKERVKIKFNMYIVDNLKMHKIEIPINMQVYFTSLIENNYNKSTIINRKRLYYFIDTKFFFHIIGFHPDVNNLILLLNADIKAIEEKATTTATTTLPTQLAQPVLKQTEFTVKLSDLVNEVNSANKSLFLKLVSKLDAFVTDLNARLKSANARIALINNIDLVVVYTSIDASETRINELKTAINRFYLTQIYFSKLAFKIELMPILDEYYQFKCEPRYKNFLYEIIENEINFCGYKRSIKKIVNLLSGKTNDDDNEDIVVSTSKTAVASALPLSTPTSSQSTLTTSCSSKPPTLARVSSLTGSSLSINSQFSSSSSSTVNNNYTVKIDKSFTKVLLGCPYIHDMLIQKLSATNATVKFNQTKEIFEITRVNKGNLNEEKWQKLVKKAFKTFYLKKIAKIDYNLNDFNIQALELDKQLDCLRSIQYQCRFIYDINHVKNKLYLIGLSDSLKQLEGQLKKYLNEDVKKLNKNETSKVVTETNAKKPSTLSASETYVIDLQTQPKLAILFQFNKIYLKDFCKNLESIFHLKCIVNESVKKPSKMSIQLIKEVNAENVETGFSRVQSFIDDYFKLFKLERLKVNSKLKLNSFQYDQSRIVLRRLNRENVEISGVSGDVDKTLQQLNLFIAGIGGK